MESTGKHMSFWDTLFGGGDQTTTSTQTPQVPGFIQQPLESVFTRAGVESERPYTPYGQPRLAPTSNFENASYGRLGEMFQGPQGPQYKAPLDYATTLAASAGERGLDPGQFTDPGMANAYMSPYMESVIQSSQDEARRSAAGDRQTLDTQAAQMGAFGGGRHAVLEAERERNLNRLISDIGVRGRQSAFENAQTQYNADRGARLGGLNPAIAASGQIGNLATTGQTLGLQGVEAINQAGQQQRGTQQSSLDLAYQDFLNQRNDPRGNIQFLSNIIRGNQQQPGQTSTATTTGGQPSFLAQGLGAGLGAYTLGRGFNLFRKGGAIKSSFAQGGSINADSDIVLNGISYSNTALRAMPISQLKEMYIKNKHPIIGQIIREKSASIFLPSADRLRRSLGQIPKLPKGDMPEYLPQSYGNPVESKLASNEAPYPTGGVYPTPLPPTSTAVESAFQPPPGKWEDLLEGMPRTTEGSVRVPPKSTFSRFKATPSSAFEKGREASAGLPPPTMPQKPQESDFFDRLNQPAFAAAMRMMGAQRGENLFQTLGAAGTAALTQRGAMKKETREETKEKLERDKFGLETRKTGADIEESKARNLYYEKQAKTHGSPVSLVREGDTILKYPDGHEEVVKGALPATVVTSESRVKPALDASKYAEDKLKTELNTIGGMQLTPSDLEKKRLQYQLEYYMAQQIPVPKNLMEKAKKMGLEFNEVD